MFNVVLNHLLLFEKCIISTFFGLCIFLLLFSSPRSLLRLCSLLLELCLQLHFLLKELGFLSLARVGLLLGDLFHEFALGNPLLHLLKCLFLSLLLLLSLTLLLFFFLLDLVESLLLLVDGLVLRWDLVRLFSSLA